METHLQRVGLAVVYQVTLLVGIMLLPVALLARRIGIGFPYHRFLGSLKDAYARATDT
ncbi:MAG: hypothetical protein ABEJ47_01735 [Halorhabdus sp.]